jgi:Asp-tRNA(Asn)/Glu-tRNA(Gln) amidotransferase C subunit|tara:strand:- start:324 stop:536 length:213 start_codon:yes stop_codon:yes gene_type:complete
MSYGRSKSDLKIEADQVAWLAKLLGLDATPEETAALTAALSNQLSSTEVPERFDLSNYPPILSLDAKWYD